MEYVNLEQGSTEWNIFRTEHYPASEAPAVMDSSKFSPKTPEELALIRVGARFKEVSVYQQKMIFDPGHEHELYARFLVEKIINESLSPVTGKINIDGLLMPLSSSFDGLTFDEDIVFEHKMWNESLAEDVKNENLDPHYFWQLEQQLLVSKAKKAIFVTSDAFRVDTKEEADDLKQKGYLVSDEIVSLQEDESNFYAAAYNFEYMYYKPVFGRDKDLIEGWKRYEDVVGKVINRDPTWKKAADKLKPKLEEIVQLKARLKLLESRVSPLKAGVIDTAKLSKLTKLTGDGIEVAQRKRKGSLDEEKLKKALGVDSIDSFRKESTFSWIVKQDKTNFTKQEDLEIKQKQDKQGGKYALQLPVFIPDGSDQVGLYAW